MATHSSTLAWKILWMEESGGLQSTGLQRVGHHWVTSHSHIMPKLWLLLDILKAWSRTGHGVNNLLLSPRSLADREWARLGLSGGEEGEKRDMAAWEGSNVLSRFLPLCSISDSVIFFFKLFKNRKAAFGFYKIQQINSYLWFYPGAWHEQQS